MTKPSDFILNSDYLALAQSGRNEFTANFPAQTHPGGYAYDTDRDFQIASIPGAIDRVLMSRNGSDYMLGSFLVVDDPSGADVSIKVYRPNSSTVRVRMHVFSNQTSYTVSAQTVKVKIASFQPPNVF